jgi:hypothetical protein
MLTPIIPAKPMSKDMLKRAGFLFTFENGFQTKTATTTILSNAKFKQLLLTFSTQENNVCVVNSRM